MRRLLGQFGLEERERPGLSTAPLALQDRVPQEVLALIYEWDPTFRQYYHDMMNRDIVVRVSSSGTYHYVPHGIHALVFSPKFWALETDLPVQVKSHRRKFRILRFFLDRNEFQEYQRGIQAVTTTASVLWKDVESFMLHSFLFFTPG